MSGNELLVLEGLSPPPSPIPVLVLAGFLGAGKTTLLNRLLSHPGGRRLAALVNDFGQVNIDAGLVERVEGEDLISLENGCVCCTIRGDLLGALVRLLRTPSPPDAILVEASGLSYPSEVARTLTLAPLRPYLSLDGIVGIVDCEQALGYPLEASGLAAEQAGVSDIVILNRVDLVDAARLEAVRTWVRGIVPLARLVETSHAQVPVEVLFGLGGAAGIDPMLPDDSVGHSADGHPHVHPDHSGLFFTWTYRGVSPLVFAALRAVVDTLPVDVLRSKGWIHLADLPDERVIFQQVGTRATLRLAGPWDPGPPRTDLVFISLSSGLDTADLRLRFESCRADLANLPLTPRDDIEEWMRFQR
jgi:G3E family GTPase